MLPLPPPPRSRRRRVLRPLGVQRRPPKRRPAADRQKAEPAPATSGLRPAQFYVDDGCDDYLRSIRAESLVRRLDVSGSAVVRLALHRLREEMTPTQIVDRLAEPAADAGGAGRKRH